jgi:hypothetical protein
MNTTCSYCGAPLPSCGVCRYCGTEAVVDPVSAVQTMVTQEECSGLDTVQGTTEEDGSIFFSLVGGLLCLGLCAVVPFSVLMFLAWLSS